MTDHIMVKDVEWGLRFLIHSGIIDPECLSQLERCTFDAGPESSPHQVLRLLAKVIREGEHAKR